MTDKQKLQTALDAARRARGSKYVIVQKLPAPTATGGRYRELRQLDNLWIDIGVYQARII